MLFNVVCNRFENNQSLINYVQQEVEEPFKSLVFDDILSRLIAPPTPKQSPAGSFLTGEPLKPFRTGLDYLVQEAKNKSLGFADEEFVIKFEQARLAKAGQERLASKIEHISQTRGDSAGYYILSFEESGRERLIAVKTTAYGSLAPFYVTLNEVEQSAKADIGYYLYRTFNFRRDP